MNTVINSYVDSVLRSFEEEETSVHDYEIVNIEDEPGFRYEPIPLEERDPSLNNGMERLRPSIRRRFMYYLDNIGSLENATSGSLTYVENNDGGSYVVTVTREEGDHPSTETQDSDDDNSDGHSSLDSTDLSFFGEDSDLSDLSELSEGEDVLQGEENEPSPKPSCFVAGILKLRSN